ncbi:MAG: DNA cytosine methyltransferase [Eubacteriales bacterium]|nr:DNA cytosine methyltransferase [Eubacteriales bacterium]
MLKTIDLFAGAGGLSLGFQLTGEFELLAAAEISKNAKATYKANIAKDNKDFIFIDNVINCNFTKLNEELGGIDVVIVERLLT